MEYFKITCSNGYCGCDEDFYIEAESEGLAENIGNEIMWNEYSFIYPDERYIGYRDDYETNEDYENAIEEYQEEYCNFWITEITKEEYEEYKRDYS